MKYTRIIFMLAVIGMGAMFLVYFAQPFDDKSVALDRDGLETEMLSLAKKGDGVAMYQLGAISLDKADYFAGYVWYKLALVYLAPWVENSKGKKGETRFNDKYLVKDIYKVNDEVRTALPLIESRLSASQKANAERVIENFKNEIGPVKSPKDNGPGSK